MDPTTPIPPSNVEHATCATCQEPINRMILVGEPGAWLHANHQGRHRADPDRVDLPTGTYMAGFYRMATELPDGPEPDWDDSHHGQQGPSRADGTDPRCDCGREVDFAGHQCTPCRAYASQHEGLGL